MLKALVVANLVASGAHFTHNAVFLERYPGPLWIPGPAFVMAAWCVVAAALILGYHWYRRGRRRSALAAVSTYSASCILVFGHYAYGPPSDFDFLTNTLIALEGAGGIVLLTYFVPLALRMRSSTSAA